MNTLSYEYIIAIAEEGTILGAAEKLHLSQSALSQALSREEKEAGGPLFVRSRGKKVSVTPLGELYLKTAENMIRIKNDTYAAIRRLSHDTSETIRIGICNQAYAVIADRIMELLKTKVPDLNIYFYRTDSANSLTLLKNGSVDLAVFAARNVNDSVIETAELYHEHLVLAVSGGYSISDESPLLSQLSHVPFIYPAVNTFLYTLIPEEMKEDRIRHPSVYKSSDAEEIFRLIENGYGAGFVPSRLIPEKHSCLILPSQHAPEYSIMAAVPKYSRRKETLMDVYREITHSFR